MNDTELTAAIDACRHEWVQVGPTTAKCIGPCQVVLHGVLANERPAAGMDWHRAALVNGMPPQPNGAERRQTAEPREAER
jgi:hypothetical protein